MTLQLCRAAGRTARTRGDDPVDATPDGSLRPRFGNWSPWPGVFLHWAAEFGQLDSVSGGEQWVAAYAEVPGGERHLALHDGHLCAVDSHDRPFVAGELLSGPG